MTTDGRLQRVTFIPRVYAKAFKPRPGSVLIGISDPGQRSIRPQEGWKDTLFLHFHDADVEAPGVGLLSEAQAQSILDFVTQHPDAREIVVHCQMGRSRSAAVAIFLSEWLRIPCYREDVQVNAMKWNHYNRYVLRTLEYTCYGRGSAFGDIES